MWGRVGRHVTVKQPGGNATVRLEGDTIILSGPADDFQRRALVEKLGELPGVNEVRWDPASPVINNFPPRRAASRGAR